MIRAVIVMNTQGKPRLLKFYEFQPPEKQQELTRSVFAGQGARNFNTLEKPSINPLFPHLFHIFRYRFSVKNSIFCVNLLQPDNVSNFVEADAIFGPVIFSSLLFVSFVAEITKKKKQEEFKEGTRLVYKHLATLYFVFVFDSCENELAMLDLIQVLVETLDRCFKNVCELDIVFNFNKMHTILDEIIFGGQVLETSSERVLKAVEEISRLEKSSSSVSFVPKSVSGRFGR
ncbi:AP-3 complex subunit [Musa troglodytarum]|uniref:AP-3 complex subunit n=1 Tax=Musa troglodytarum TaxID=320322 RepID=A0A9E7HED6_9LILI|nr:AP-3 complex subunit [Musa troglodytarum]